MFKVNFSVSFDPPELITEEDNPILFEYANEYANECANAYAKTSHSCLSEI